MNFVLCTQILVFFFFENLFIVLFLNWICAEILDFCDFLSPTPEEQESRNTAIQSVFDVIKYIWPTAEVHRST